MEVYKKKLNIGIYCIRNLINGKRYIGQSCRISKRWTAHRKELNDKTHRNQHLERAWHKYGEDNFKFEVILYCDRNRLDFFEMVVAKYYKSIKEEYGYNLMVPDVNSKVCWTEEMRKRKCGPMPQAQRDKISAALTGKNNGKPKTAYFLKKLRERSGTYEVRLRIAIGHGAKPFIVSKDGKKVGGWTIKKQCAREIGVSNTTIKDYLNDGRTCKAGFSFKYI